MRRLAWYALFLVGPAVAQSQSPARSIKVGPGNTVVIGKVDSLWSPTLKEYRKVLISTPPSYSDTTYPPKKYPVLYLLDGDIHFQSVTGLIQILAGGANGAYAIPEMIVVAIPNTNRTRDLTPTHIDKGVPGLIASSFFKTSGGMPNFFRFLQHELIPRIDSMYRAAPYRVLVGHSLGGIAAIDALYTMPETFNAYVVIDPSVWYDDMLLLKKAKDYLSKPGLAGRALFLAQANTASLGSGDTTVSAHFGSIVMFNSVVEMYNKSGLRYAYKYYPDDSHGTLPLIAEYDALRFIFAPYNVSPAEGQGDAASVKEHFERASTILGYRFLPPEPLVDQLGRLALGQDTTKAINFFRLNTELYPNSSRAYDSLGDGWMAKGDSANAMGSYEKALALRPGDRHAKDMIRKMQERKP